MTLADEFGYDENKLKEQLDFLEITPGDQAKVRELSSAFESFRKHFTQKFYEHLETNPYTSNLLKGEGRLERLKKAQEDYFSELLKGLYDKAYIEKRLRVGQVHQMVGLEPIYYLAAYNQYVQITFPKFLEAEGKSNSKVFSSLLSLVKVIFLDIALALDTYFKTNTSALRKRNEELQRALGMYLQSQRREEQFRQLLSHEIRGGIAAIITSLEVFLEEEGSRLSSGGIEQVEGLVKRCWSMTGMLKDMLAGEDTPGPGQADLNAIFDELRSRFFHQAQVRKIRMNFPNWGARVIGDPVQIREALSNLISNSLRWSDKKDGLVSIRCGPAKTDLMDETAMPCSNGQNVLIEVEDNGPGIPQPVLSRLFEPFVKGPATPGRPAGTGLGLFFVKTLIEGCGGKIIAVSNPGQGACFTITLLRVS